MDRHIRMANDKLAPLGGRIKLYNGEYMYLYYSDSEKPTKFSDPSKLSLVPYSDFMHEYDINQWKQLLRKGTNKLVIGDEFWDRAQYATEMEVYDASKNAFINIKTNEIYERLDDEEMSEEESYSSKKSISEDDLKNIIEEERKNSKTSTEERKTKGKISMSLKDSIKNSITEATKLTVADKVNDVLFKFVHKTFNKFGFSNDFMDSEKGKLVVKSITPMILFYVASTQAEFIDQMIGVGSAEKIAAACEKAQTANLTHILPQLMEAVMPSLQELKELGQSLAASDTADVASIVKNVEAV